MKELSYFLLQMTTPEDILAANSLEMHLRCLRGESGFDNAIAKLQANFPERLARPWVPALLDAIRPFYVLDKNSVNNNGDEPEYVNPLAAFLSHTVRTLTGGQYLWSRKPLSFNVSNLPEGACAQPYMQWCALLAQRHQTLTAAGIDPAHILRLCQVHPIDAIPDEQALALSEMYIHDGNDHSLYMTFPEFIREYIKSRGHFLVENEQLLPELAEKMAGTLRVWEQSGQSMDDHLYWLSRNYDFHWMHYAFLRTFITKTLNIEKQALA